MRKTPQWWQNKLTEWKETKLGFIYSDYSIGPTAINVICLHFVQEFIIAMKKIDPEGSTWWQCQFLWHVNVLAWSAFLGLLVAIQKVPLLLLNFQFVMCLLKTVNHCLITPWFCSFISFYLNLLLLPPFSLLCLNFWHLLCSIQFLRLVWQQIGRAVIKFLKRVMSTLRTLQQPCPVSFYFFFSTQIAPWAII